MLLLFVSPHLRAREFPRSRASSQTCNLARNPHILTRHRSTAELGVDGIETRRTESLTEEPSPESNDLAMSRLRIQETIISHFVGLAPSLNVCTKKKELLYCRVQQYCCNSQRVLDTPHSGSIPWATSNSINLPASVAARGV